jgi:arylsulfatase A-like enzyme
MLYAPYAPHGPFEPAPGVGVVEAPVPYRSPAYYESDVADKPGYIRRMPSRSKDLSQHWNETFAALETVDLWVGRFARTLREEGLFDNTYFVYLSDNGLTWGDHRWRSKLVPYERSILVPFIVAGPRIRRGVVGTPVANVDLAATILDLAGVPALPTDGVSLRSLLVDGTGEPHPGGVLLEHKDFGLKHNVPNYCGLRTERRTYIRYATGFRELYNLGRDPHQLENRADDRPGVVERLDARMLAQGCELLSS